MRLASFFIRSGLRYAGNPVLRLRPGPGANDEAVEWADGLRVERPAVSQVCRKAGDFRGDVLRLAQEVRLAIAVVLEDEDGKLKKLVTNLSLNREQDPIRRKL